MTTSVAFLSRQERFQQVASTNDVVRRWLAAGTPEVCLAVAGSQTAGRGRGGRTWQAPEGAGLLLSLGFRPAYLPPDRLWRLAAVVSMAMIDAAEEVVGLREGTLRLKWPNDIVVDGPRGTVRKVAGVLGETDGLGTRDLRATIGLGLNTNWLPAAFPAELVGAMTSLLEASGGRPVEDEALLEAFIARIEPRVLALREGLFDIAGWHDRQVTTGRLVELELPGAAGERGPAGPGREVLRAVGVDGVSGALIVEDPAAPGLEREVLVAEVVRVRLAGPGARETEPDLAAASPDPADPASNEAVTP